MAKDSGGIDSVAWRSGGGVRTAPPLCHFSRGSCELDGVRLTVVVSALCFHYKMSGRLKGRDSAFRV